jgi:uncharacterized protein (TIGR02246 family)
MKRLGILTVLATALGCAPAQVEHTAEEAERQARAAIEAIEDAASEWTEAFRMEDPDRLAVVYTPNAVLLPMNAPLVAGDDAIVEWAERSFADAAPEEVTVTTDEIEVAGDWAWRRGHFEMTLRPKDGEPYTTRGRFLEIWERRADGSWKIARDIWNTDEGETSSS